jgi:signal transduction histidine kinase
MTFRHASRAIEPVTGLAFALLWINAESGRVETGLLAFIGFGLAIALSRVAAIPALGLTVLVVLVQCLGLGTFGSTDWPAALGIALVVLFTTAQGVRRRSWIPGAVGAVLIVAEAATMAFQIGGWSSWTGNATFPAVLAFLQLAVIGLVVVGSAWGVGYGVRAALTVDELREANARARSELADSRLHLALAEERERVAQELHDVLAHSLTVIVAQADGARFLRSKRPAAVEGALTAIAASARDALADVGAVIDGVLDGERAPQPGLTDLSELIASVRSAGLDAQLTWAGEPPELAPGRQLAAYRIVQEGLTNALRHRGRDSRATVVLDARGPGLSIQIVSEGGTVADGPSAGRGRGIPGMQERARVAGGWLTAGPDGDGAHRVTAFVPYRESGPATGAEAA